MMNNRYLRLVLICALASLLVAVIAHQNMLKRMWDSDQIKVGVPIAGYSSDLNDNYIYFGLLKRGTGACRGQADEQTIDASGNPLTCTYISAIVADNLLYEAIKVFAPDRVIALGALLIAQTSLLAFAALLCIQQILQRYFGFLAALVIAGGVIFLSDAFSWSLRFRSLYTNLPYIWQYEANVVRLVSPTAFWTLGLLAIIALLALMRRATVLRYATAGALLTLSSASSIAVGANIGAGVGLAFIAVSVWRRRVDFPLLFAGAMLLLGLVWQEWFFRQFYQTELGSQLGHGSFIGIHFEPFYLILLIPVVFGRIGNLDRYSQVLLKGLLVGSVLIGAFSDSVELGDRLWLRGATMIAFVLTIAWAISSAAWLWRLFQLPGPPAMLLRPTWRRFAAGTVANLGFIVLLTGFSDWVRPYDPQRWFGVVERQRLEAIQWIGANTTYGDLVASGNIDDTNLVEFYTDATAFVGLYGMTALPFDEVLRRYFFVADLVKSGDEAFRRLQTATASELADFFTHIDQRPTAAYDQDMYQTVGFYELVVYQSYNAAVPHLFANGTVDAKFVDRINRLRDEARQRRYTFKYLLVRAKDQLRLPGDFQEVFRNSQYAIYSRKDH